MTIFVGTSGFSYPEWRGSFYPEKHPPKKMLSYYGQHFRTVEINATFYRMPKETMLTGWLGEVPDDFTFVLKAPRFLTHHKKDADMREGNASFAALAKGMGARLGPVLYQLPQFLKKDVPRLEALLAGLPRPSPVVIEVGDPSWFSDDVYEVLKKGNAALCIVDDLAERRMAPFEKTSKYGYLRLRRAEYSDAEIGAWAKKIRDAKWTSAHVFFKHEDAGTGPTLAKRLLAALGLPR